LHGGSTARLTIHELGRTTDNEVPDEGVSVVVPLDGGHGNYPVQVLGMVAGGGEDDPLLSGDVLVYISPTPVVSWQP
jgi:hypothetical protein